MTIKRDHTGVPILVQLRCGGKGGKCGRLVASVKDYFGNLVLVSHKTSGKTPLEWHGGVGIPGCPAHGEKMRDGGHWVEQNCYYDLEHAAEVAVEEDRTVVVRVVAVPQQL